MAIGTLSSNSGWSSVKFNGTPVTDRFIATTENQEFVPLVSYSDATKLASLNSITITADDSDLYFSVLRKDSPKSRLVSEGESFDFTDEPVFFVEAEDSITLSGLGISGIKFSNNSGARYFIQGMAF